MAEHSNAHDQAIVEIDSEITALIDTDPALNAGCPLVDCDEHLLLSRVAHLFDGVVPIPPRVRPLLKKRQDLISPSVHLFLRPPGYAGHVPFGHRIKSVEPGLLITAAAGNEHLAHDFRVLHRLPRRGGQKTWPQGERSANPAVIAKRPRFMLTDSIACTVATKAGALEACAAATCRCAMTRLRRDRASI